MNFFCFPSLASIMSCEKVMFGLMRESKISQKGQNIYFRLDMFCLE